MILNTIPQKSMLTVFIACGSVMWLKTWHQYGYSRSPISFPPFSSWWRDTLVIVIPVLLAVWIGILFAQRLIDRSKKRMSLLTQSALMAIILGGLTSIAIMFIENSKVIWTGIGNEYVFLASICSALYPDGNTLLSILQWIVPGYRALRLHILLQDGLNLMLFNLAITVLLIMLLDLFVNARNHITAKPRELDLVSADPK